MELTLTIHDQSIKTVRKHVQIKAFSSDAATIIKDIQSKHTDMATNSQETITNIEEDSLADEAAHLEFGAPATHDRVAS